MRGVRVILLALVLAAAVRGEARRNDVDWQPWSPATFARARAEGKLVLLDNAAEWCHWCHVMDRTTYADPAVAKLIAAHFLPVKIDVDAHPDLAERYGDWGWPATIVFSSTMLEIKKMRGYIEPKRFLEILTDAVQLQERTKGLGPFRDAAPAPPEPAAELTPKLVDELRAKYETELSTYFDPRSGGWGFRQKSSTWMNVEHALARHAVTGVAFWKWRATMTLDRLVKIMDPVWGGVYQYSTDGDWDHPHFEKLMTYQAGTLESYALAALATGDSKYLETAKKLFGYMSTMLVGPDGAFYASQDADVLRPSAGGAPVDGHAYYALPDALRRKLGMPRIDEHVYARENGLAILACVRLYAASGDPAHLAAAVRAGAAVLASHALRGGVAHAAKPAPEALIHLADNAAFGRGLLALYEATGEARWFSAAQSLAGAMDRELADPATGAFFAHSADPSAVGDLATRRLPVDDNVVAGRFLLRLAVLEDAAPRRAAVERLMRWLSAAGRPLEMGRFVGAYLMLLEELACEPLHVTVVGAPSDPGTAPLVSAAHRLPHPFAIVEYRDPGAANLRKLDVEFPPGPRAAAFVCTGSTCSLPIFDPVKLAAQAARISARRGP